MQNFDTTAPIAAVLEIPAGRVQFIAAERGTTTVEVRPMDASRNRDVKQAEQTTVEFGDGVLRVRAPEKNHPGSVEVTVQLPAASRLQVKTASVEFRAVGRFGDVFFEGAHGPVKIDEADGVHVTSAASDISVGRLNGPATITTAKGDIVVTEAVRGTVVLKTQAGNLSVGAAAGASATLDAGTSYGRITNSLRSTGGLPDLTIHATTAYGDIDAHSVDGAQK